MPRELHCKKRYTPISIKDNFLKMVKKIYEILCIEILLPGIFWYYLVLLRISVPEMLNLLKVLTKTQGKPKFLEIKYE